MEELLDWGFIGSLKQWYLLLLITLYNVYDLWVQNIEDICSVMTHCTLLSQTNSERTEYRSISCNENVVCIMTYLIWHCWMRHDHHMKTLGERFHRYSILILSLLKSVSKRDTTDVLFFPTFSPVWECVHWPNSQLFSFFQSTEECCLHHNEAVYDQDLHRKSWGWVRWECHSSCCGLPAPEAGAVSKNIQKPTVPAQCESYVQDNNCESHCHIGFYSGPQRHTGSYSGAEHNMQSALSGCVSLTKPTLMMSLWGEAFVDSVGPQSKRCPVVSLCRQLWGWKHSWQLEEGIFSCIQWTSDFRM